MTSPPCGTRPASLCWSKGESGRSRPATRGTRTRWLGWPGGAWQPWDLPIGPPLGITDPALPGYAKHSLTLLAGQQLLAFTDGVTEAGKTSVPPSLFQHQMPAFLAALPQAAPADEVVGTLVGALQTRAGASWPEDDTTILSLCRR